MEINWRLRSSMEEKKPGGGKKAKGRFPVFSSLVVKVDHLVFWGRKTIHWNSSPFDHGYPGYLDLRSTHFRIHGILDPKLLLSAGSLIHWFSDRLVLQSSVSWIRLFSHTLRYPLGSTVSRIHCISDPHYLGSTASRNDWFSNPLDLESTGSWIQLFSYPLDLGTLEQW